jgi:hypothetical protein
MIAIRRKAVVRVWRMRSDSWVSLIPPKIEWRLQADDSDLLAPEAQVPRSTRYRLNV